MYGLAHEAKDSAEYLYTLRERGDRYLILDNGADELGTGMTGEDLADLIEAVEPNELILPDVLEDSDATIHASEEFYRNYRGLLKAHGTTGDMKLMAVAQGQDLASFLRCYRRWVNWSSVKILGIPYDIEFWTQEDLTEEGHDYSKAEVHALKRLQLLTYLKREGLIKKPIHLLGINNLWELRQYRQQRVNELQGLIRSNDTTAPFAGAMAGKDFRNGDDLEKDWPRLDFKAEWGEKQSELVIWNLHQYFTAAGDNEALFNLGVLVGKRFEEFPRLTKV
jgi:hypothetical protein